MRSQATVHAFMHAAHTCSMHEGRGYRYTFQRARVASSPEVPKVTWWKIATFLGYHLHWLTSLETSRHFRKIALRLGIFLAMFRECLCVVARQLAPKCCDFSNVAKLARQCKWPYLFRSSDLDVSHKHYAFLAAMEDYIHLYIQDCQKITTECEFSNTLLSKPQKLYESWWE